MLSDFSIRNLLYGADFPGIIGDIVVFVVSKNVDENNLVQVQTLPSTLAETVPQRKFKSNPTKEFTYSSNIKEKILKNISQRTHPLGEILNTSVGFIARAGTLTKQRDSDLQNPVLKGENVLRYSIKNSYFFQFVKNNLVGGTQNETKLESRPKILIRKTGADLIATLDERGVYPEQSLYFIYGGNPQTIFSVLAILNSKLMNWYYQNFAITNKDSTPQLKKIHLDKFPIVEMPQISVKQLSLLADKILNLNKKLLEIAENSNEWERLKSEIEKTDKKIDDEVYKLYGLTEEEIKVIEGN